MTSLINALDFGPGLDIAGRCSAGASRTIVPENQDNLVLIDATGRAQFLRGQSLHATQVPNWPAGHVRIAVLDGMGGHGHGRQAAEAVAAGLLRMPACRNQHQLDTSLDELHSTLQVLFADALGTGNSARRPGTTLTLVELPPGQPPLLFHVGDSRLYEITASEVRPLTVDHVPATSFAMHGLLGEQEWWEQVHGEHRPQISQAFVLGNAFINQHLLVDPLLALDQGNLPPFLHHLADRRTLRVRSDAVYLLASDGFWACTHPDTWVATWPALLGPEPSLPPGQQPDCAGVLVERLFERFINAPPPGLHIDNLTAIVMRFTSPEHLLNVDETALPSDAATPGL